MLVPGVESPHLCAQCSDYPCVKACPVEALSIDDDTPSSSALSIDAVLVDRENAQAAAYA